MDIRKIKKLIEMLQDSDLKEIEVSQGDESVRISRDNRSQIAEPIIQKQVVHEASNIVCLLYTSPSPRDVEESRMPSSA